MLNQHRFKDKKLKIKDKSSAGFEPKTLHVLYSFIQDETSEPWETVKYVI